MKYFEWIVWFLCLAAGSNGPNGGSSSQDAFFQTLSQLCGARFEGQATFPGDPNDPFAGKLLVAEVSMCQPDEIRIPFAVGEDRSRTWILKRGTEGLSLKHDHRHADGTPDTITMYGGWAIEGGSAHSQSFAADEHTAELIPEAVTNVWTLSFDPDKNTLTYDLKRHGKPRFKAVLKRK